MGHCKNLQRPLIDVALEVRESNRHLDKFGGLLTSVQGNKSGKHTLIWSTTSAPIDFLTSDTEAFEPMGVRLWDMVTMRPINGPNGAGNRGKTTALTWIRREDEPERFCWRQCGRAADFEELSADQMVDPGEVSGIAFDAATNRLVFGRTEDCVPKAISFGEFKGNEREIVVFGLYDGRMLLSGDAVVNSRKGVFCIDDVFEGPALYRLNDEHRVRTFGVESTKALEVRPRQIRFADEGEWWLVEATTALFMCSKTRTGEILEKLRIGAPDWIQTITCFVVAGFLAFAYEKVTRCVER
ncbi:hypothetical protein C8R43DRAFT_965157 [Mycena crocata]|nr:hypothetical protein C8R43DRAFT_965157 [Mycena crocata]